MPETAPWGVTLWQLNGPESTFMLYMKHVGNIKVYCNHKVSLVEITEYMEGLDYSRRVPCFTHTAELPTV